MERLLADGRKVRLGYWFFTAVLALLLVGAVATPARAGGVHFSVGIGIPLPAFPYSYSYPYPYPYPSYSYSYPGVVAPYPPHYAYAPPPVYPPVWFAGQYRGHYGSRGRRYYHRPAPHFHSAPRHYRR
jgi:hypothetical protein